ncbi:LAO/AO transport system ATPase [Candidatus Vecturithrix granuli]|uniref:LAO/AO transport system ATPase n=1 Tax=Vecturithrix granuli TaxID=1499967 RepID=A0A081BYV3_VECG1|nr:LAO/AO transport system ATPase [Candidatus Vecturithrix granuli]
MIDTAKRPEWVPENGGTEFASRVMPGVAAEYEGMAVQASDDPRRQQPKAVPVPRRKQLSVEEYVAGVLSKDRTILARAITLVESNLYEHLLIAQSVIKQLLPHAGKSIRIGITGVPGVGKSTFIEAFGCYLCDQGHQVAVLAVDPSSSVTRGSILGDKTRMENLARRPACFIRPSPSGGTLGGVTRKSRETMIVCEAAGFDVLLVETVGVGQNEVTVRSMVDFMLLLMIAGAGDELQGIKKGIMELADALLINKADGDNIIKARAARMEYEQALHYLAPATKGWTTHAYTCSSLTGDGISEIWQVIEDFCRTTKESGMFQARRQSQVRDWLHVMVEEELKARFYHHPNVLYVLPTLEKAVIEGKMPVTTAAKELLKWFDSNTGIIEHF